MNSLKNILLPSSTEDVKDLFQQRCFLIQEAIQDAATATTLGILSNYRTYSQECATPFHNAIHEDQLSPPQRALGATVQELAKSGLDVKVQNQAKEVSKEESRSGTGSKPLAQHGGGYIPSSVRLCWLLDGEKHVKQLLYDLQRMLLPFTLPINAQGGVPNSMRREMSGSNVSNLENTHERRSKQEVEEENKCRRIATARGRQNKKLLIDFCELELKFSTFTAYASEDTLTALTTGAANANTRKGRAPKDQTKSSVAEALIPLVELAHEVETLRSDMAFKSSCNTLDDRDVAATEKKTPQLTAMGSDACTATEGGDERGQFPLKSFNTKRLQSMRRFHNLLQTLQLIFRKDLMELLNCILMDASSEEKHIDIFSLRDVVNSLNGSNSDTCVQPSAISSSALSSLPVLIQEIGAWLTPLVKFIKNCATQTSIATMANGLREKLKRLGFDVEKLQAEQEKAITDGDMVKSEEIYYQQATLLESMEPIFTNLEEALESYKSDKVTCFQKRLSELAAEITGMQSVFLEREREILRCLQSDRATLMSKQEDMLQIRAARQEALKLYLEEWEVLYTTSMSQQTECLRAMEQLERRMKELAEEQNFLIYDRLKKLKQEHQYYEDSLAFESFAAEHGAVLKTTQKSLSQAIASIQEIVGNIKCSCTQLGSCLDAVSEEVDDAMLQTRKDRHAQFRQLYFTLGDLQFKKARHLEEVEKKMELYQMQQRVAMDTLNPKAKTYSQMKKRWEALRGEVQEEVAKLNCRCEASIEAFKRTEQALLEAGVVLPNPVEELTARNKQRQQKLLEYRQMMEDAIQHKSCDDDAALVPRLAERKITSGDARSKV